MEASNHMHNSNIHDSKIHDPNALSKLEIAGWLTVAIVATVVVLVALPILGPLGAIACLFKAVYHGAAMKYYEKYPEITALNQPSKFYEKHKKGVSDSLKLAREIAVASIPIIGIVLVSEAFEESGEGSHEGDDSDLGSGPHSYDNSAAGNAVHSYKCQKLPMPAH